MRRFTAPALILISSAALTAQTVRVDVRNAVTNLPVPYSTIALLPGDAVRFTNDSGAFSFADLSSGPYRLVVRAIGYAPYDTTITVAAQQTAVHVGLQELAIELPPVTVVGRTCLNPGPPIRDSQPELAAIFDQLRENAARYRLLSDQYPFLYALERRVWNDPAPKHGDTLVVDTLELRSDVHRPYKPGNLVSMQPGTRGRMERILRLPTVIDLADPAFHTAHCFRFAGVDTIEGAQTWRVDFYAAERLHAPDVAGSAWLDADTYQLRQLTFRLTRPERALSSMQNLEATVVFGDLLPSVSVPVHIASKSEVKGRRPLTGYETQRLLRVDFLKTPPGRP